MHKCEEKCLSSDRLKGLHFICHKCSSKTFADCAAKNNDMVMNMLLLLKVVVADDKMQPKANVTIQTKTDFDLMFGRSGTFAYICEQCKSNAPNENNEAKDEEIGRLQMKIEELEGSLDEKVKLIQSMADASDKNESNKTNR